MRLLLIIFLTCFSAVVHGKKAPFKVAILDTGFTPTPTDDSVLKLCDKGHYDYDAMLPEVGEDTVGHGAGVTFLINRNAKTKNMCYLIYKVFGDSIINTHLMIDQALLRAHKHGVNAVNMSLYMRNYSHRTRGIIKMMAKRGVKFFVSSGNSGRNLNEKCYTYPVCYKRMGRNLVVVGSTDVYGGVASYSNYGARVDIYELGDLFDSRGTSFAAPRALGKYINSLNWDKRK